jgi:hypothetical protein
MKATSSGSITSHAAEFNQIFEYPAAPGKRGLAFLPNKELHVGVQRCGSQNSHPFFTIGAGKP